MFGRPRDIAAGNNLLASWQGVTKGYTDHEHLNEQQLIHMNGRIYDFNVGRFLSVDPFLQFPENSQSANPYSYILNNPMSGIDPTGYCAASMIDSTCETWAADNGHVTENAAMTNKVSAAMNNASQKTGNSLGTTVTSGQSNNKKSVSNTGNTAKVGLQTPAQNDSTNVENDSSLTAANNMAGQPKNNLTTEEKFFSNVIQPTLKKLGVNDPDAEVLLLGTAIHESHLTMRDQMGKGPAKGLYQMEPATHDDIWDNYLKYHPKLAAKVKGLLNSNNKLAELRNNDSYATAMAYVHYDRARFRTGQAFPSGTNIQGMAQYWKKNYNTSRGKGTVTKFVNDWWNATTKP